ncbi:MAG TPA: MBL fold metallo-hydrolase [Thermoanaerobaculia bacterium]
MSTPTMTVTASCVKVRMYRQGLGDCFLLAFPTHHGRRPCYMLIDCGVLHGTADAWEKMRKVAESLREATGGRIDVLVVTHQHWDHLSGFEQAREVFDKLEIGEVWAPWTEDPNDPLAQEVRERRASALRALHAAARRLRLHGSTDQAGSLESLLSLFGEPAGGLPAAERALHYVLNRAGPSRFCALGEQPRELPGGAAARVHVLGPPRDEALLTRHGPSRQNGGAYEKSLALDEESAFHAAALWADEESLSRSEVELRNLSFPFDRMYRVAMDEAEKDTFFRERYFDSLDDWRRIDADWLDYACDLALRLDSDIDSTSLALAIELLPSGRVLFFPADAQLGDWLSWHGHAWRGEEEANGALTVADLLRRTVVYKVGHHASHNVALREQGLELMESPELVALVPVDEEMARQPKSGCPEGWDMPSPSLLARLVQKTRGRVVRADTGLPEKPPYVSARDWKAFEECCRASDDGLYIELTIGNPAKNGGRSS